MRILSGAVALATLAGSLHAQNADELPGFEGRSSASAVAPVKLQQAVAAFPGLDTYPLPPNAPSLPLPLGEPGYKGQNVILSPEEINLINAKRAQVSKHIIEQQQLESIEQVLSEQTRRRAAEDAIRENNPLLPAEIRRVRELKQDVDRATNEPVAGSVNMRIRTVEVDVNSTDPLELYVVRGYASSFVFFDRTGAPWPIEGNIVGNQEAFTSSVVTEAKNTAIFDIKRDFSESNALVSLVGLNTPIVIKLIGETRQNDSRVSIRIPKAGPAAKESVISTPGLENADPTMLSVLDNPATLATTKKYKLVGVAGEIVYINGSLYVRTNAQLISPAYKSQVTSVTGQHVYQIPPVSKLLFSDRGRLVSALIEEQFTIGIKQKASIYQETAAK